MMMARIDGLRAGILALLIVLSSAGPGWAAPNVVATIRPLHSLAAQVMDGVGTPELLIDGQASPHTYAMRPSDAVTLYNAELLLWTGEVMETFLTGIKSNLKAESRLVTAADIPGVTRLAGRGTKAVAPTPQKTADADWDPHLWLDPANAAAIARRLGDILAEMDPDNAAAYRANAAETASDIAALEKQLKNRLARVSSVPYIAAHDAFQYFENAFGLSYGGAVLAHPGRPAGAGQIRRLSTAIRKQSISCLLTEPGYRPPVITRLAEDSGLKIVEADPLGLRGTPGPMLYREMMLGLADDVQRCLKAER